MQDEAASLAQRRTIIAVIIVIRDGRPDPLHHGVTALRRRSRHDHVAFEPGSEGGAVAGVECRPLRRAVPVGAHVCEQRRDALAERDARTVETSCTSSIGMDSGIDASTIRRGRAVRVWSFSRALRETSRGSVRISRASVSRRCARGVLAAPARSTGWTLSSACSSALGSSRVLAASPSRSSPPPRDSRNARSPASSPEAIERGTSSISSPRSGTVTTRALCMRWGARQRTGPRASSSGRGAGAWAWPCSALSERKRARLSGLARGLPVCPAVACGPPRRPLAAQLPWPARRARAGGERVPPLPATVCPRPRETLSRTPAAARKNVQCYFGRCFAWSIRPTKVIPS